MTIELGSIYTDTVTGFIGMATARTEYLHGCVRIQLTPKLDKDGKIQPCEWFDAPQLIQRSADRPVVSSAAETGGPGAAPPSRDCPPR